MDTERAPGVSPECGDERCRPVVFLMGPTASGKTRLAIELAQRLPLAIVSVDSAMVYRHMDIGTGKPDSETLTRFPHRLVDIRDPDDAYSADHFRRDALQAIARIHAAGRIPLLVGGTGLYFRALREGLSVLPPANPAVRAGLAAEAREQGWDALHARLARVDPSSAARIHANDPQRIQRALEVHELTGKPMSRLLSGADRSPLPNPVHAVILEPRDRARLHAHIAVRFRRMLRSGLVDEVTRLRSRFRLDARTPSMRAVGYRQVGDYLEQRCSYVEMTDRAIAATRQLARRQLTWLRAEGTATRFDCHAAGLEGRAYELLKGLLAARR